MNWRKPVIYSLLSATGSHITENLENILRYEKLPAVELDKLVTAKLVCLLDHAYKHVPFYRDRFNKAGVFNNGKVDISAFKKNHPLTRDDIITAGQSLHSDDHTERKSFVNSTGGSSGTPVQFLQDKNYNDWNIANTIYYKTFAGQNIGDRELRLWGSQRDLMQGSDDIKAKTKNWLYNRRELNAFTMTPEKMSAYIETIDRYKPRWIEAYAQPMAEIARYISVNKLKIYQPAGILTSAGTLYPEMRDIIENVFQAKVFNRYGSREAGGIACSCEKSQALHISVWNTYLEVLDDNMNAVASGQPGKIYITTLNNFSMPLIRYDIGDMGILSKTPCPCGRTTATLEKVIGRHTEVFRSRNGTIIPAEFFIHFIGVVYNKGYVEKFQVIQRDYDNIIIRIVIRDREKFTQTKQELVDAIKRVMGQDCNISFEEVADIKPLPNGKYLYTICEVPK